jgi:hypothetical protein
MTVVMAYHEGDELALERALRLFPIRTGIAVPEWIVLHPHADSIGAAGVVGAGLVLIVFDITWSAEFAQCLEQWMDLERGNVFYDVNYSCENSTSVHHGTTK